MDAFYFRGKLEDIWQLRFCKRQIVWCTVATFLGLVLGIVAFVLSDDWWCQNRTEYAQLLVQGGFFVVLLYSAATALGLWGLCLLFSAWQWTKYLCYPLLGILGLYLGADCCALVVEFGSLGVFYILFALMPSFVLDYISLLVLATLSACRRRAKEAFEDTSAVLWLQIGSILLKMLLIFVFLRLLTTLI